MKTAIKNIISFILPLTVLYVVPRWIESDWTMGSYFQLIAGLVLGGTGGMVMYLTISSFIQIGKGTLAPWSPTRKLVVTGLYRYVRNPMILGVFMVILAEALAFNSVRILAWAALFFLINTAYFIFSEEPGLEQRFGKEYLEYKKQVGRWIPRLTAFKQENTGSVTDNFTKESHPSPFGERRGVRS